MGSMRRGITEARHEPIVAGRAQEQRHELARLDASRLGCAVAFEAVRLRWHWTEPPTVCGQYGSAAASQACVRRAASGPDWAVGLHRIRRYIGWVPQNERIQNRTAQGGEVPP